ncbi:MAG: apolipoprotein N-acyltransferase [Chthoniobacterales bacterium]
MPRILAALWPWLAAVASGLLCTACFPPFDIGGLCWIALTPLLAAIWFSGANSKRRWLRNLLLGYVAGVVFFTGAFSWLGALGDLYQSFFLHGLSFLLSIYLGMHFAFWAWFVGLLRPTHFLSSWRNLAAAFLAASAWVTHEWVRGWLFSGFGWNGLGVALHDNWPLIQIAQFTGVTGVSFAIGFANIIAFTTAVRLFEETRSHQMRAHFDLTLTMLGVVALFSFSIYTVQNPSDTRPLRVAAVQANVPQGEKFDPQFSRKIFDQFERLSIIALHSSQPADLLIWPESAMPDPVRDVNTPSFQFVSDFAASTKADLLLGTLDVEDRHEYNAAALISESGQRVQIYRKLHLVPFGEYIPLRHSFPLFASIASRWVPGDFETGRDYTVFQPSTPGVQVAPLICFEDTVGELTRRFVLRGANLLVNITNDAWFLRSAGSRQHLANAVFRCVETRRPMARAANTGITCFISEFGRITQILRDESGSSFTEGVLTGDINVPQDRQLTFYTRHGELFSKFCAGVTGLTIVVLVLARLYRRAQV